MTATITTSSIGLAVRRTCALFEDGYAPYAAHALRDACTASANNGQLMDMLVTLPLDLDDDELTGARYEHPIALLGQAAEQLAGAPGAATACAMAATACLAAGRIPEAGMWAAKALDQPGLDGPSIRTMDMVASWAGTYAHGAPAYNDDPEF